MKTLHGSIALTFLAVAAGCRRESDAPAPRITRPPPPLIRALKETALEPLTSEKTNHVYRFICNRTFHEPFCIVVRVGPDGTGKLTRKMLSDPGGYNFGNIKEQHEATLTSANVWGFLALLDQENFWKLESGDDRIGMDGSWWFIEAVRTNHYQFVGRWTPETNTAVGRIGRQMIEMADWKIEKLY